MVLNQQLGDYIIFCALSSQYIRSDIILGMQSILRFAEAIHKVLEEKGVYLPACHFSTPDVELVRYAITVGLLTAKTSDERYSL